MSLNMLACHLCYFLSPSQFFVNRNINLLGQDMHIQPLPRWLSGKQSACQCRRSKRLGFDPWLRKNPFWRKWQPIPVFLLENSMDREAWRTIVHGVAKSWLRLSTHAHTHARGLTSCSTRQSTANRLPPPPQTSVPIVSSLSSQEFLCKHEATHTGITFFPLSPSLILLFG